MEKLLPANNRSWLTTRRTTIALVVAIFSILSSIGLCFAKDLSFELEERHTPSELNSTFNFNGKGFEEYIRSTRAMIASARVTPLNREDREHAIDANSPFALKPPSTCVASKLKTYRRGILLTHGLTDSPYFMRTLGRFFQENCFRVMAVLLPGHGTRPGDLLNVTWEEWAKAVAFGVDSLSNEVEDVFLGGFSTGGTLSIYQALRDKRVKGLFLFSPALKVSSKAIMANWHEAYDWVAPTSKWVDILSDEDPFKYESFAANAADQIHLVSTVIRSELGKQNFFLPVFVVASEDDASVYTPATLEFFANAIHPLSTFVLYSTTVDAPTGPNSEKVEKVGSTLLGRRIISSAHTGIVLPPDDAHYGERGSYSNCLHYLPSERDRYLACKEGKWNYRGEVTNEILKKGIILRLTFNPSYQSLLARMKLFIESLRTE